MVEKLIRVTTLAQQDEIAAEEWADSTASERFAAVEWIRRAAIALWGRELYGEPVDRLERVLRVADLKTR